MIEYGVGEWYDLGGGDGGVWEVSWRGVRGRGMYYYEVWMMNEVGGLLGVEEDWGY